MKKLRMLLMSFLILGWSAYSQCDFAVGFRAGGTSGLTVKSINSSGRALEGVVGFWNDGLSLTGIYERYKPVSSVNGLGLYYGAGGHLTFYEQNFRGHRWYDGNNNNDNISDGAVGLGIDGMLGLEYKFYSIPIALSIDMKPFVEFTSSDHIWFSIDPGLGIKAIF